jgi:hypothetical protein
MAIRLGGVLSAIHEAMGLSLEMPDDHILELKHNGEVIARFSQSGATRDEILRTADAVIFGSGPGEGSDSHRGEDCPGKPPRARYAVCPRCGYPGMYNENSL